MKQLLTYLPQVVKKSTEKLYNHYIK